MSKVLSFVLISLSVFTMACQSPYMTSTEFNKKEIIKGKSTITFYRDSPFAVTTHAPIALYKNGKEMEFIGFPSYETRITKIVDPGFYSFVIIGDLDYLVEGQVEADKHYYIEIDPTFGWLRTSFRGFVKNLSYDKNNQNLKKALKDYTFITINEDGKSWFKDKAPEIKTRYLKEKMAFEENPYADAIIRKEDGSPIFY